MTPADAAVSQRERELNYYRRECNDLGARLLRMQEEQSQAYREARRSRTVAKLIREAYRLVDTVASPSDIGGAMLEIIVDNAMCDRAAFLREDPLGSGRFRVEHMIGVAAESQVGLVLVPNPPSFFFTTTQTRIEPPAYELTGILQLPYVLWGYDRASGHAAIIGNRSESNVSRAFESGDQELIEGALSVYLDVLLRKHAEAQLRAATTTAEEAVNARAAFLATLSHELRTPLNAIIGFSEMMSSQSSFPLTLDKCAEFSDQIYASGTHLLALINDILEYSRLAKAPPLLELSWIPLDQIVTSVLRAAAVAASKQGVALRSSPTSASMMVLVDPMRFRQVLDNLVSNAIKFTPAGGFVETGAAIQQNGALAVSVRDSGIGMRVEDIPRALEPFRQIRNAYTRTTQGTGLGLPICKTLIEAHGGWLELESEPDAGTTARVVLPETHFRVTDRPSARPG